MPRVYRLSKIGAKLPNRHRYGPASTIDACDPGFEVFKGPIYSIAATVGPAIGALTEGDFTPAAGYDLILLIDVLAFQAHRWAFDTWLVILPQDVKELRSLPVADLHSWLREHSECVDQDRKLSREAVETWVMNNKNVVESWLEQHSQKQPIEFVETIGKI